MLRFSSRSKGSEPHIMFLGPGVLHWEGGAPEYLALKASGACIWESQRTVGNRDSNLIELTQNPTCSKTQCRGSNLKGPQVRPTC